jgi:hypothetical protein
MNTNGTAVEGVTTRPKLREAGRLTEVGLLSKYPHVVPGSLAYDGMSQKQSVEIKCGCGTARRIFTSDLFQIDQCVSCTKIDRKERRKARKAEAKATATAQV